MLNHFTIGLSKVYYTSNLKNINCSVIYCLVPCFYLHEALYILLLHGWQVWINIKLYKKYSASSYLLMQHQQPAL